jgi:hypothetical protein
MLIDMNHYAQPAGNFKSCDKTLQCSPTPLPILIGSVMKVNLLKCRIAENKNSSINQ